VSQPAQNPLNAFATPMLTLALGSAALMIGGIGLWFWFQGDALVGGTMIAVALFDVALLTVARVWKKRAQRERTESGYIEPMENRPPT
jgi:hypothetical protein